MLARGGGIVDCFGKEDRKNSLSKCAEKESKAKGLVCRNNCGLFGLTDFNGYCSACFRKCGSVLGKGSHNIIGDTVFSLPASIKTKQTTASTAQIAKSIDETESLPSELESDLDKSLKFYDPIEWPSMKETTDVGGAKSMKTNKSSNRTIENRKRCQMTSCKQSLAVFCKSTR